MSKLVLAREAASQGSGDANENVLTAPLMRPGGVNSDAGRVARRRSRTRKITDDTECGIGWIRGRLLQSFATKNVYVFVYGLLGCVFSATYAYSNGTITTLEKRFKIPSKTIGVMTVGNDITQLFVWILIVFSGIITVGNDITQLFVSMFLSYYAGKGHRPRWIGFGIYTVVIYCLLTALPHFLYGPGKDALSLTAECANHLNSSEECAHHLNATAEALDLDSLKKICVPNAKGIHCDQTESHIATTMILFVAQLISGIGGTLFYTVGVSYMDDNIQRNKTPALISFSYFLRMLGPALGFALASFCLNIYISPTLTPTIDKQDPRWLGAWWIGWIILGILLMVFGSVLGLFPKVLPKAAARKAAASERARGNEMNNFIEQKGDLEAELPASLADMMTTFKRLMSNPTLMCNNLSTVFYFFGYMPYWVFMPKYIETQYRQSASLSSLITGTVGLVFSAVGVLLAGVVITKYRPSARQMAMWNTLVGLISVLGIVSYIFLGCPANDSYGGVTPEGELQTAFECNNQCDCEYVTYSPVCASDGKTTFISACHAGCSNFTIGKGGAKTYTNCSCIPPSNADPVVLGNWSLSSTGWGNGGEARPGSCPMDCTSSFFMFLAVVCLLKFSGATGRATNFLVSVRCVEEKDKPVAMGLGISILSLFAFIPSPIFYGYLIDSTCLVWGKTCTSTGNCWLYNDESLRYLLNLTSAVLVMIGTLFDAGVWYYVKNLQIFDDEEPPPAKQRTIRVNLRDNEVNAQNAGNHLRAQDIEKLNS